MVQSVPAVKLNSGHEMPLLGLGTWKSQPELVEEAVKIALEYGYRHIDCAKCYENEDAVGRALKYGIDNLGIKREDLWKVFIRNQDHAIKDVRPCCLKTIKDLQLDYLDMYLMHWPEAWNKGPEVVPPIWETYLEMEKLVQEGLVKTIGIGNFSVKKIQDLLEHVNIVPAVNQVELHPFLRQDALIAWCKEKGIHVTAYSPLGSPDSASLFNRKTEPNLLRHPSVTKIALKLGKTNAQVLIRWALQRGTSVIPKSSKGDRIQSNLRVIDWELSKDDFETLSSFEPQYRYLSPSIIIHPEGPYRCFGELWDDPEEDIRLEKYVKSLYSCNVDCAKVDLKTGLSMPLVGLSARPAQRNKVKEAVLTSIRSGYRHIDCSQAFENEDEVGEALDIIFSEGIVKREELWITSKLVGTNFGRERVLSSVIGSLDNLKVKQLDLLCMVFPYTGIVGPQVIPSIKETWQTMEELVEDGHVRCLGLCNFSIPKMQQILSYAKVKPAVCQIETHPYFRNEGLIKWCEENEIHVTTYMPFGGFQFPGEKVEEHSEELWDDPVLERVSQNIGKTKGQVLIRWAVQNGVSAVHKAFTPDMLENHIDVFDWELSKADFSALHTLEPQIRVFTGLHFVHPKGPYTTISQIWDE